MKSIKKVTEAYSMQPKAYLIGNRVDYYDENSPVIEVIRREISGTANTPLFEVYNGYDKDGDIIFQVQANAVNVEFLINK